MKILVLGGSVFLGRAVVEAALSAHHHVTVLNRGLSQADVPGVEAIVGDRNSAETLTEARTRGPFDLVVDTSGFEPESVALSGEMLSDVCEHYVFVSTVSAFEDWPSRPVSEGSPLSTFSEEPRSYGASKAECERVLRAALGRRLTVLYPGAIVGPGENVGRLPWWLARHAQGGEIVYPERELPIAPIDVRDIADFVITLAESRLVGGRYVVSGEEGDVTLGDLLTMCANVTGSAARPVRVPDALLLAQDVEPWSDLPLWAPRGVGADGVWSTDCSAAREVGLHLRPLVDTVTDTWLWMKSIGVTTDIALLPAYKQAIGLSEDKKARVLAAFRDQRNVKGCSGFATPDKR